MLHVVNYSGYMISVDRNLITP